VWIKSSACGGVSVELMRQTGRTPWEQSGSAEGRAVGSKDVGREPEGLQLAAAATIAPALPRRWAPRCPRAGDAASPCAAGCCAWLGAALREGSRAAAGAARPSTRARVAPTASPLALADLPGDMALRVLQVLDAGSLAAVFAACRWLGDSDDSALPGGAADAADLWRALAMDAAGPCAALLYEASLRAEAEDVFSPGCAVRIVGLENATHLNDRRGIVQRADPAGTGRWLVELQPPGPEQDVKTIRPENLILEAGSYSEAFKVSAAAEAGAAKAAWRGLVRGLLSGATPRVRWGPEAVGAQLARTTDAQRLLRGCAHVPVQIGEVALLIGGLGVSGRTGGVAVVDCRELEVRLAELAPGSIAPAPRIRHGACGIMPTNGVTGRAVVVGGVSSVPSEDLNFHGAREVLVLDVLDERARQVCWHTQATTGRSPGDESIFHHVLSGFNHGRGVACWGGDVEDFQNNTEFLRIRAECHARSDTIYLLDVATWVWSECRTTGQVPGHRSLAQHCLDRQGERLIILGGSRDPKPPRAFEHGELADMVPVALDLRTLEWTRGCSASTAAASSDTVCSGGVGPAPRTRFATERLGDWLLGFGGRDSDGEILGDTFLLNLRTLSWPEVPQTALGSKRGTPVAMASVLAGAALLGGLQGMGVVPCPQADVLLLDDGGVLPAVDAG